MGFGADHQHPAVLAGPYESIGKLERVDEAGTLLADIETGNLLETELALQERGRTREKVICGHRREDDVIDVGRRQTRVFNCLACGGHREI